MKLEQNQLNWFKLFLWLLLVFIVLMLILSSTYIISAGERGILLTFVRDIAVLSSIVLFNLTAIIFTIVGAVKR